MRTLITVTATLLLLSSWASAQRYQSADDGNYINGELYADYEEQPARPAHPTPRSYNAAAAPAQRPAPSAPKPTPVAILKQINRHNEDGSYTYGFEGADGSFKIETKQANGEVKGKYGFVDDGGKVRVVEYGADKYGFQPSGEGITVAPPTYIDETTSKEALEAQRYEDYQEQLQQQQQQQQQAARPAPPPRYNSYSIPRRPAPAPAPIRQPQYAQAVQYTPQFESASHTQAVYPSQARLAARPPQAIFTPAASEQPSRPPPQQLQAILYAGGEEQPQQPGLSAYRTGPVQFGPSPSQEAQPRPRPQPQARSGGQGLLDQLARDYALPQDSAPPLHDISFGYY